MHNIHPELLCIAAVQALPKDGKLTACDRDARPLALARQAFAKADVLNKVINHNHHHDHDH